MSEGFEEAYHSLQRAKVYLDDAAAETDPAVQSSNLKLALHALCQATRLAHRRYDVAMPTHGSLDGGTRTWAKNELEEFMSVPFKEFSNRRTLSFEEMEQSCRLWLGRAKYFVDRLAAESTGVARSVDDKRVEWHARNVGRRQVWEEKDGKLVERNE